MSSENYVAHDLEDAGFDVQEIIGNRASLHAERVSYRPRMPAVLKGVFDLFEQSGANDVKSFDAEEIRNLFPHTYDQEAVRLVPHTGNKQLPSTVGRKIKVGVLFSGGPAPGGHNVLTGLLDFLKRRNNDSQLVGFLGGPSGLVKSRYVEITEEKIKPFRNLGGFHFLGSGRTKIETPEQLAASAQTCIDLDLDGVVIIGGDDSNTNASVLAEYFASKGVKTNVCGVPKTIDGDLRNDDIEASFGFDTASKVFSSMVSNVCFDAISSLKAYHFVRVMGRDASHITLEVALQTHPNLVFISEEIAASGNDGRRGITLVDIVNEIVQCIVNRAKSGKDYGVIVIPEGLVGFVPDMKLLLAELNELMAKSEGAIDPAKFDSAVLTEESKFLYDSLPEFILRQMMAERDPHGNVQVSKIETERLLAHMVRVQLDNFAANRQYHGKFNYVCHFFGYEGRCGFPSKFDCDYCYTLGSTAGALLEAGKTGLVASVKNLARPSHEWTVGGTPITRMMNLERRKGKDKPVIKKKLVDLNDAPFLTLQKYRHSWILEDDYRMPGPIQHAGGTEDRRNFTLLLEAQERRNKRRRTQ
jgi:pyrophosphate--fructose-6-phosphate 1-phosphotransferase